MHYSSLKIFLLLFLGIFFYNKTIAQDYLYAPYTTAASRAKLYRNLIEFSINKNLSRPLNDSTEQNWEEAFDALELLLHKNDWVDSRINYAVNSIQLRTVQFQRALLELIYTNYPGNYIIQISALLQHTVNTKIFAMCAEYILWQKNDSATLDSLDETIIKKFAFTPDDPIIAMLNDHILSIKFSSAPLITHKSFINLLDRNFLPGQIVMYSFQRKNRDYPGLVIVRNKEGKFIRDSANNIFNVPQLARSIANLPGYLTNGNTPEGIFKMHGFSVSKSNFIGPSPNIQLSLPVEMSPRQFIDSTIQDSIWSIELYAGLIPQHLRQYSPLYNSFYAGLAGRTEIIAHGTTIDAEYYKSQIYYPHTPSQGCLSTKEIWNGKRIESNQKKLVNALLQAGGADGYCVVLELNDKQQPVMIEEILPFLSKAESVK
ncbi:MAG: hypothetical protein ABIN97_05030 [Ginsengibacter sp.]